MIFYFRINILNVLKVNANRTMSSIINFPSFYFFLFFLIIIEKYIASIFKLFQTFAKMSISNGNSLPCKINQ